MSSRSKVGKRAYNRALQRAAREGSAVYKGRVICSTGQRARVLGVGRQEHGAERRGVFCWNPGGMSAELYAELLRYLETRSDIDIAITQETHWSTTGEWKTGHWQFVHTASDRKGQDGVLVAVKASLLTRQEVCCQEIIPGRLLRLRVELRQQCYEILGIYQHALSNPNRTASETAKVMTQRNQSGELWTRLCLVFRSGPCWRSEVTSTHVWNHTRVFPVVVSCPDPKQMSWYRRGVIFLICWQSIDSLRLTAGARKLRRTCVRVVTPRSKHSGILEAMDWRPAPSQADSKKSCQREG